MIVSGATMPAAAFKGTALFDAIVERRRWRAAARREFARKLAASRASRFAACAIWPSKHPQAEAFLQFAKTSVAAVSRGLAAPVRALEAVGASVSQ